MYEARKELQDTLPGVYINEDLTGETASWHTKPGSSSADRGSLIHSLVTDVYTYGVHQKTSQSSSEIWTNLWRKVDCPDLKPDQHRKNALQPAQVPCRSPCFGCRHPCRRDPSPGTPLLAPHRELSLTRRQQSWVVLAGVPRLKSLRTTIRTTPWTGYDCRARSRTVPWRLGMLIIYKHKETSIAKS